MKPSVTFDLSHLSSGESEGPENAATTTTTTITTTNTTTALSPRRVSRRHSVQLERRRSVVEIDQALLAALMRDVRLARLIQKRDPTLSPASSASSASASSASHSATSSILTVGVCGICRVLCTEGESGGEEMVVRTATHQFHHACLRCGRCATQLDPKCLDMDAGRAYCRGGCSTPDTNNRLTMDKATSLPGPSARPLKGILKKPNPSCV